MGLVNEKLHRTLSKVLHLGCQSLCLQWVREQAEVYVLLESVRLEHVIGELCSVAILAVAKHKINPLVQVRADVVRLQSMPIFHHKVLGAARPLWQRNVVDFLLQVVKTQVKAVLVDEEAAVAEEEFWDELLVVGQNGQVVVP